MFALISSRPSVGFAMSFGGAATSLLAWLHVITPILGFFGAAFGALAGFFTLLIKWREWRGGK